MGTATFYRPSILNGIAHSACAVIEASAGTGKTFAIEHLVIDLLLSGECTVEQILVVTFTEKATTELRVRIRQALARIVFGPAAPKPAADSEPVMVDESGRRRLEDAYYSFDRAPIFTIHGFCHRVLTDFAFQSGALLDLQLTDGRAAFHRAFRAELRTNLAVNVTPKRLLEKRLMGSDTDKGDTADTLENLLFEAYRHRYLDSCDFGERVRTAERLLAGFNAQTLREACRHSALRPEPLRRVLKLVDDVQGSIEESGGSPERLLDLLESIKFDALFGGDRGLKRELKFSGAAGRLMSTLVEVSVAATSPEWRVVDAFLPPIRDRLERDKREHGLIDYDDMLAWVWRALDGPGGPALAAALRARFRCALVDEFQDTDDLQWRIFRRLFVECGGARLYVVGDPKQAIYAFRGADVFTYLKARAELTGGNPPVELADNFRSTEDLIKACNHIFDPNAANPLFQNSRIRYDRPVRCGRPDRRAIDAGAKPITPVILMRYQRADLQKASVPEIRRAIGRHLARELRRLLDEPGERITIEEDGAPPRLVGAKGIFVLTRTRQESAEIGEYLREARVPFAFYKQEGLFQTSEAGHVLDVLRAIAQPHIRSHRLKAWLSPFFAVPLREVALLGDIQPAHPLNERLYEWKALAERQRFAELFQHLLHDSGVAARELFLSGSERRLTNYEHIFEILLAAAMGRRLALPEIIALLEDYISERAAPELEDSNIQRLESERDAVSVITVHMSKGLEADVVALFGGFGRIPDIRKLAVYHDEDGNRRFAIGKAAKDRARQALKSEEEDEERRLLYVALTRARVRLYLPLLPDGATNRLNGYYAALNNRLQTVAHDAKDGQLSKLFTIHNVAEPVEVTTGDAELADRLLRWRPPQALMDDRKDAEHEAALWNLRRLRTPLVMRSYTSLRASGAEEAGWNIPVEEFKGDLEMPPDERDLPGGRAVGLFLHEVIEKVAMDSFAAAPDLGCWRERDDVKGLFYGAMRRNQVRDQQAWFERGTQIVFNALAAPIVISEHNRIGPLYRCRSVREMEFVYPIPEAGHRMLGSSAGGKWTVERGYLKGFVDFVFEHNGLIYFADWKSDQLPSYERAPIEAHVRNHYQTQALIYSIGVLRLLHINSEQDYRRFGGLLYIFLRGMDGGGRTGVYFHRPAWTEVCTYEAALMRLESEAAAR